MTKLRWARPDERDKIQTYLFENMGKISHKRWRNILDCRWNYTDDRYGVVVEENDKLVGFLGIVFADRTISGKNHRIGNITSWFLEKHLRRSGLGQEMLALITEGAGITYTATSANFRSGALLKKIGWQLLEDTRLFWHRSDDIPPAGASLISDMSILQRELGEGDLQIVLDHKKLNLTPHLFLSQNDERLFFVTYVKRKGDEHTAYYEILHASDPLLLAKYVKDIANILLPKGNTVLSSDKRFISPEAQVDANQQLQVFRYFQPSNKLTAQQVDFLYGEVVLLDLKIY